MFNRTVARTIVYKLAATCTRRMRWARRRVNRSWLNEEEEERRADSTSHDLTCFECN